MASGDMDLRPATNVKCAVNRIRMATIKEGMTTEATLSARPRPLTRAQIDQRLKHCPRLPSGVAQFVRGSTGAAVPTGLLQSSSSLLSSPFGSG